MEIPEAVNPLLWNISDHVNALPQQKYCEASSDIRCISDKVREYIQLVNIVFISGFLALFGIASNVINIIVFIRLGFRETINISLLALSISDLGASIMLVWVTICFNPLLIKSDVDILFNDIYYYTGMYPRDMFMMITAILTVFISIERFLCIYFPLKVKSIMTQKLVTSIVITVYVIIIACMLQAYTIFRLEWLWNHEKNKSMIISFYTDNYRPVEVAMLNIQIVCTFSSYIIVSITTALFAWKLKVRSKWRHAVSKDTTSSARDQQVIKMVTMVAVIFIVCYFPTIVFFSVLMTSPEIDIWQMFHNLYMVGESFVACIGAVNSSVNIFVYYNMMSKYRSVFQSLFTNAINKG